MTPFEIRFHTGRWLRHWSAVAVYIFGLALAVGVFAWAYGPRSVPADCPAPKVMDRLRPGILP